MVTSLRASNCRFRNENLLKGRGSENIGTANSRAQRLSVLRCWFFFGCKPRIFKISNLIDQSLSTVDSRSETEGWIYELLLFLYRVTL